MAGCLTTPYQVTWRQWKT